MGAACCVKEDINHLNTEEDPLLTSGNEKSSGEEQGLANHPKRHDIQKTHNLQKKWEAMNLRNKEKLLKKPCQRRPWCLSNRGVKYFWVEITKYRPRAHSHARCANMSPNEPIKFQNAKYSYVKSRYLESRQDFNTIQENNKPRKVIIQKRGRSLMTDSFEFRKPKNMQNSSVSLGLPISMYFHAFIIK